MWWQVKRRAFSSCWPLRSAPPRRFPRLENVSWEFSNFHWFSLSWWVFILLSAGKQKRLKQAKEEAQDEIEKYRQERERQFKEFEAKASIQSYQWIIRTFIELLRKSLMMQLSKCNCVANRRCECSCGEASRDAHDVFMMDMQVVNSIEGQKHSIRKLVLNNSLLSSPAHGIARRSRC